MIHTTRIPAAVIGVGLLFSTLAGAQPKIEEQVLAPLLRPESGHKVGPHGIHLASVVSTGNAGSMIVDGVEVATFDQLIDCSYVDVSANPELIDVRQLDAAREIVNLHRVPEIRFSNDGRRYAFAFMSGPDCVVFADGKELWRGKDFDAEITGLRFSPGGKHVYFIQMPRPAKPDGFKVIMDGKAEGPSYLQPFPVFSPDDSRYAYVSTSLKSADEHTLIIDGKPAAYVGVRPIFDGKNRLLSVKVGGDGGKESLLVDGKPLFASAAVARIFPDPSGRRVAASASIPGKGRNVFIDDKPVASGAEIDDFVWSPDGSHYAAAFQSTNHKRFVVYDGKMGPELEAVSDLLFSPDSKQLIYVARLNGAAMVMLDNERGTEGVPSIALKPFFYGPPGAPMVAWIESKNSNDQALVMGDRVMGGLREIRGVNFSSDGAHFAFAYGDPNHKSAAIDGQEDGNFNVWPFANDVPENITPKLWVVLSPDGAHSAFVGSSRRDPRAMGVVIDGTLIRAKSTNVSRLHFTPDSKHVVWIQREKPFNKVYVDGELVAEFDLASSFWESNSNMWEMGPDGVFMIMGPMGDKVKRLRITPPTSSSIDTMLAKARAK